MSKWTTKPPTEPGWYWHRYSDALDRPVPMHSSDHVPGGEWWPDRIEEPSDED